MAFGPENLEERMEWAQERLDAQGPMPPSDSQPDAASSDDPRMSGDPKVRYAKPPGTSDGVGVAGMRKEGTPVQAPQRDNSLHGRFDRLESTQREILELLKGGARL
jgi:hypothetical protein